MKMDKISLWKYFGSSCHPIFLPQRKLLTYVELTVTFLIVTIAYLGTYNKS